MNRGAQLVRATAARGVVAAALAYLKWRAHRMAQELPIIPAAEIARIAEQGGPDDMVLLEPDGSLTLDSTPDDIATYQQPDAWPKYVCRVSTVVSALRRRTAEEVAAQLHEQMVRQTALQSLRGPAATPAPAPPGNAPRHVGGSAVSIRPGWL